MTNTFKYLFGILLIVGGFIIGSSWSNTNNENDPNDQAFQADAPMEIPAGLNPEEKATIRLFESACPSVAYITTSAFRQNFFTRDVAEIPKGSVTS